MGSERSMHLQDGQKPLAHIEASEQQTVAKPRCRVNRIVLFSSGSCERGGGVCVCVCVWGGTMTTMTHSESIAWCVAERLAWFFNLQSLHLAVDGRCRARWTRTPGDDTPAPRA